jgi:hypothetical protein
MCPFSFLQTIRKIAWSKGNNSSELSNFDTTVKKKEKKKVNCQQKEKKKGGDEEGRSSLMPKPNDMKKGTSAIHHYMMPRFVFFLIKRGMAPHHSIFL